MANSNKNQRNYSYWPSFGPGWGRGWGSQSLGRCFRFPWLPRRFWAYPEYRENYPYPSQPTQKEEKEMLTEELKALREEMKAIEERLKELENKKKK